MTQPAGELERRERSRAADVRVGSTTNALVPVSMAQRSVGAGRWHWAALTLVGGSGVLADQATKQLVTGRLAVGEETAVIGPFSIHHVQNSGIAFGFLADATALVIALTAVALAWMLLFFGRSAARHPVLPAALGLVISGSLSNLIDRIRLGYVTDFLDIRYWPAFNLADTFIVVGVAALLAVLVTLERPRRSR